MQQNSNLCICAAFLERELGSGAGVDIDSSPLDGLDVVSTSGSLSIDLEDLEAENAYTDTVVALNDFETPTESSSGTSYDAKLVAMSGLHAELLELNEQLHTDNLNKERTIHHLRNEINVLRGPLPGKREFFHSIRKPLSFSSLINKVLVLLILHIRL